MQQQELAKAIHLHQSVLNRIEKGTRPARDLEIRAIARFFHISADVLLGLQALPEEPSSESAAAAMSGFVEHRDDCEVQPSKLRKSLSSTEYALIEKYRELDDRGKATVRHVLHGEYRYLKKNSR